jgi:hypothetical protein
LQGESIATKSEKVVGLPPGKQEGEANTEDALDCKRTVEATERTLKDSLIPKLLDRKLGKEADDNSEEGLERGVDAAREKAWDVEAVDTVGKVLDNAVEDMPDTFEEDAADSLRMLSGTDATLVCLGQIECLWCRWCLRCEPPNLRFTSELLRFAATISWALELATQHNETLRFGR